MPFIAKTAKFRPALSASLIGLLWGLGACSGSESAAPSPEPVNVNPTLQTETEFDVDENVTGVIFTLDASDIDGAGLGYFISDGDDAEFFEVDRESGEVRFVTSPDFENPDDTDGDNVYVFEVRVEDGRGGSDTAEITVTVADVIQDFQLRRVGEGFTRPVFVSPLPDQRGKVIVLEKDGRARVFDPDNGQIDSVDFIDLSAEVSTESERGLLGMAMSPDFLTDKFVYINMTNLDGDTEIRRYQTVAGRTDMLDPSTADVILKIEQPFRNHNGGWLGFGPDGLLYILTGDGGGQGDPNKTAQDDTSLLGKLLRIDVSGDDFPEDDERDYIIPEGNGDFDDPDTLPEIFAKGFRNPYRASFVDNENVLMVGDVGEDSIEEVNLLDLEMSGQNFGWSIFEGTLPFEGETTIDAVAPVIEYSHGDGEREGNSVVGGYVFNGPIENLQNEYIFADFVNDQVWSINFGDLNIGQTVRGSNFTVRTEEFAPDTGDLANISSFGLDEYDNLYVVSLLGFIYRLEAED